MTASLNERRKKEREVNVFIKTVSLKFEQSVLHPSIDLHMRLCKKIQSIKAFLFPKSNNWVVLLHRTASLQR